MRLKRLLATLACGALLITGCSNLENINPDYSEKGSVIQTIYYTASFYNYNDSFLYSAKVREGGYATYNGPAPTRENDTLYRYTFKGWDKDLNSTPINEDTSFYAEYTQTLLVYYDVQFVNFDGTLLYETKVEEGKEAIYGGPMPTRESANGASYTFSGWNKSTAKITADTVFIAQYTSKLQKFSVKFLNYDDSVLDITYVEYGEAAVYTGETPTRPAKGEYAYKFSGWDSDITVITQNTEVHAVYKESTRYFTVNFVDHNGSLLYTTTVAYGKEAKYSGKTPTRNPEGRYQYEFTGWSVDLSAVYSDLQVTAKYEKKNRECTTGLNFRLDPMTNNYYVTGYSGNEKDLFIAKEYNGAKVVGIDENAFSGFSNITSIFLEDNIKTIGNYAFRNCSSLKTLRLSENLTTIGSYFLQNCTQITSITLPKTVSSLNRYTFTNSQVTELKIEDKNPYYKYQNNVLMSANGEIVYFGIVLYNQRNLKIEIPEGVKTINSEAFYSYSNISSVTFPSTLLSIGSNAFQYCGASTYTFKDCACTIGYNAFYNCSAQTINFGKNIKRIENYAFAYCYSLKSISLPASLEYLDQYAFNGCNNVTSISIDKNSDKYACMDDAVITSADYSTAYIILSNSTKTLHIHKNYSGGFDSDSWRQSKFSGFEVDEDSPYYCSISNMIFSKDKRTLYLGPRSGDFSLTKSSIPEETLALTYYSFYNSSGLKKIDLSETNVESIGYYAFQGCSNLTEAKLNNKITQLSDGLFENSGLKSFEIPSSVTRINWGVFYQTALTEITVPESVEYMSNGVFYYCRSLKKADLSKVTKLTTLYSEMFYYCTSLTDVKLPPKLTQMSSNTFYNCSSLKKVELPETLTSINSYSFYNCTSLEEIRFPEGVTSLQNDMFENCTALKNVYLPGVTMFTGYYAFQYCQNIKMLVIPSTVQRIYNDAFYNCTISKYYIIGSFTDYSKNSVLTNYLGVAGSSCAFYSKEEPEDTDHAYWYYDEQNNAQLWK